MGGQTPDPSWSPFFRKPARCWLSEGLVGGQFECRQSWEVQMWFFLFHHGAASESDTSRVRRCWTHWGTFVIQQRVPQWGPDPLKTPYKRTHAWFLHAQCSNHLWFPGCVMPLVRAANLFPSIFTSRSPNGDKRHSVFRQACHCLRSHTRTRNIRRDHQRIHFF